jgi:Flp pilus assembly protein TadG
MGLRHRGDERGSLTVEMLYAFPTLLTLVLLLAQATLWWHAVHVAQATASDALAATRVQDGTVAAGTSEADRFLKGIGEGPLRDVAVRVTRSPEQADVTVTAHAAAVVPFLHLPVRVHAGGPVERFRPGTAP